MILYSSMITQSSRVHSPRLGPRSPALDKRAHIGVFLYYKRVFRVLGLSSGLGLSSASAGMLLRLFLANGFGLAAYSCWSLGVRWSLGGLPGVLVVAVILVVVVEFSLVVSCWSPGVVVVSSSSRKIQVVTR